MHTLHTSIVLVLILIFTSCASSGVKIVIPSYSPPKEVAKISKIQTKDEFISDGAYLALWINPDILHAKQNSLDLSQTVIDNLKEKLTQTNFIAIDPMGDENGVALNISISTYNYSTTKNRRSLELEMTFTLTRGFDEFLVKKYRDKKRRQSSDASKLPSQQELSAHTIKKLVKYFIADISPLKTHQLREFKSFPSELSTLPLYIKQKNYAEAIKLMQLYQGAKDMNYYYNLALLYEADASTKEDLTLLRLAKLNYTLAINNGGISDELITKSKSRFESFYLLLNKTESQREANQALINDRNSLSGSSDDEYE